MKSYLFFFSFSLFSFFQIELFAQQHEISGIVSELNSGSPLIGASVSVEGRDLGTITDSEGKFKLLVPNENISLNISFVGYETKRVKVARNQSDVIISLNQSQGSELSSVVVVGYGTQKKADVTGAISSVSGSTLRQSPVANISNSMEGLLPGVIINNRSGQPGMDAATILIRGKGTLNDNSPLIVIDGVANVGGFDRLNPEDIKSITILKDASAAIYGAQAANGVILVTTKRGVASVPSITYDGSFGLTQPTFLPKLVNAWQFATYRNEIDSRTGAPPEFSAEDIQNFKLGNDPLNYPNTNWFKSLVKDLSPQTRHSISVNGGNKKILYFLSGSYLYQNGIFHNSATNYNQYNIRANIDANLTDNFQLSFDNSGRFEDRHYSNVPGDNIFGYTFNLYPTLPAFYPNGLPGAGVEAGRNPILMANGKTGYEKVKDYFYESKISFDLKMPYVTKGLSLTGLAAYDFHFNNDKTLNNNWDAYTYNKNTGEYLNFRNNEGPINLNEAFRNFSTTTYNIRLNYEHSFNENNLSAFIAYEQSQEYDEGISAFRTNYLTDQIDQISLGGNTGINNSGTAFQFARRNVFGRVTYNFNEKYLAEFILRHDGSYIFPKGKRWGTFPGASVGWVISKESFFKELSFINFLKLRASWGRLGNDKVGPYQYLTQYNTDPGYYFGASSNRVSGLTPSIVPNPDITWEVADNKNIGIEAFFFNNSLSFSGDYFSSKRSNILLPRNASIPLSTGLNNSNLPTENIGIVKSEGYEFDINYRGFRHSEFSYNVGLNLTVTTNKIIFMDEAAKTPDWQKREGHPMDSWLIYRTDGIFRDQSEIDRAVHLPGTLPGDIHYLDENNDGKITSDDMVRTYESATPLLVYGIPINFSYKGIGLNILFQGQGKAKQMVILTQNPLVPPLWLFNDRWTPDNPEGKMPPFDPKFSNTKLPSDFWLRNAAFLRLKNVELSYSFPEKILSRIKLKGLRVYLNGFNLFVISPMNDFDPELNSSTGGYYPQTRVFNFGVNLSL